MDVSNVGRAVRNPRLVWTKVLRTLNKVAHTRAFIHDHNPDGVDIFEQDWDTMIVLDACRYDAFESRANLPGTLESRRSRGSTTFEFVRSNFRNKELLDTVYVSANGWFQLLKDDIDTQVHEYVGLHTEEYREEHNVTTYPEVVTEHAARALEKHPDKRLLVHYLQPHSPFIGEFGRQHFEMGGDIFEILRKSEAGTAELTEAYHENLSVVLSEVRELLDLLEGRTVVTADHGELLGDRSSPIPFRDYGHPSGTYVDELVEVPWQVVEEGERREIVAEEPGERTGTVDEDAIEDHLQSLGYKL